MLTSVVVRIRNISSSERRGFVWLKLTAPDACEGPVFGPCFLRRIVLKPIAPQVAASIDQRNVGFPNRPMTSSNCRVIIIFSISPCVVLPSLFPLGPRGRRRPSCRLVLLAFSTLASSSHNPHCRMVPLTSQQLRHSSVELYSRCVQCESPLTLAIMQVLRWSGRDSVGSSKSARPQEMVQTG